ncbi:MAG: membrane protein insertase YidC [Planctomycetaceae bacterium]
MDQRRLLLFVVLSVAFLIGWGKVMERLHPRPEPQAEQPVAQAEQQPEEKPGDAPPAAVAENDPPAEDPRQPEIGPRAPGEKDPAAREPAEAAIPKHPDAPVVLGSENGDSRYFLDVRLTSKGAGVVQIDLNDPRYRKLDDRDRPLTIVGSARSDQRTFDTRIEPLDAALGKPADELNWELVDTVVDSSDRNVNRSATYRLRHGGLEVTKTYRLEPGTAGGRSARDAESVPYQLHLDLTVKNVSGAPQKVAYLLQGPVGVPLENADNARYHRGVRVGFLEKGQQDIPLAERSVTARAKTAAEIADAAAKKEIEEWRTPIRFIGVDEQYFAALVVPQDQLVEQTIDHARAEFVKEWQPQAHSDVSAQLQSIERTLEPGNQLSDSYALFAGPKRQDLLAVIGAEDVQDFGWFGFVAKPMLWLLNAMHNSLSIPYGIAIIFLTMIVRGAMFPLSKKQTASAKMMKELQPKIAELKKKHGNDKEKMARAQMELFSKHNYNPFAGCLPILLQLPIFIGLYQALGNAVDLRLASFLWADNLAAPDALFPFPGNFRVPIVGWTEFNLLPIITIVLFIVQQKMFMPPPTDEQSAMQQKMMKYMMIFMGFLFYRVPAGLCVYFIASALWGLGERKVLDWTTAAPSLGDDDDGDEEAPTAKKKISAGPRDADQPAAPKKEGLLARLLAAADSAGSQQSQAKDGADRNGAREPRGKKKRSKPRR